MMQNNNDDLNLSQPENKMIEPCLSVTNYSDNIDLDKVGDKVKNAEYDSLIHAEPILVHDRRMMDLDDSKRCTKGYTRRHKDAQDLLRRRQDYILKRRQEFILKRRSVNGVSQGVVPREAKDNPKRVSCTSNDKKIKDSNIKSNTVSTEVNQSVEPILPDIISCTCTNSQAQDLLHKAIDKLVAKKKFELEQKVDAYFFDVYAQKFDKAVVEITAKYSVDGKQHAKLIRRAFNFAARDLARLKVNYTTATRQELKAIFGVSRELLDKWAKKGTIKAIQLGKATRYRFIEVKNAIFGRFH